MAVKRCARAKKWGYPWWCIRDLGHEGPCALERRWFYWILES